MQEAGEQRPALVAVDGCSGRSAESRHQQCGAVVVFGCPAEEVSDLVAGGPVGEPVIAVGLSAFAERDALLVEPVQEAAGGE